MTLPKHLIDGYKDFANDRLPQQRELAKTLAEKGQKPETMVIACCDSRAAPEMIFGADPGEMFVVRNVANLVQAHDPEGPYHSVAAALEFAVLGLGVKHVVVMGHAKCGGIAASLSEDRQALSATDLVGQWIKPLLPLASDTKKDQSDGAVCQLSLERKSVLKSLDNLKTFPFVAEKISSGELSLHGAWFDISAGELWTADDSGDFTIQEA